MMNFMNAVMASSPGGKGTRVINTRLGATFLVLGLLALASSTTRAAFKDVGFGARPGGMGNAFVAVSDDMNAPLFNPAGLSQVEQPEFTFMYHKPFLGFENVNLNQVYSAVGMPAWKLGTFGAFFTQLRLAGYTQETQAAICWGRWLMEESERLPVAFGVNLKYLNHSVFLDQRTIASNDPVFARGTGRSAFTVDAGVLIKPSNLAIGMSAKNITSPDTSFRRDGSDKLPVEFRQGISYLAGDWGILEDIRPSLDVSVRLPKGMRPDLNLYGGVEAWIDYHTWGVRLGGNTRELTTGASFGKTFGNFGLQIDYSFLFPIQVPDTLGSHRVSLSFKYSFGPAKKPAAPKPPEREAPDLEGPAPEEGGARTRGGELIPPEEELPGVTTEMLSPAAKQRKMKEFYKMAYDAYRAGDYPKAVENWSKVLDLDPNHELAKRNRERAQDMLVGRVNINTASFRKLRGVGLTTRQARRILQYRREQHGFKSVDDLLAVRDIDDKAFKRIRDKVRVQ